MAHVGVRGQMENELRAAHRRGQRIRIERVATHQSEARMPTSLHQELGLPRGEVVVADDLAAVLQQAVHEVATDEAGTARHEVCHCSLVRGHGAQKFTLRSMTNIVLLTLILPPFARRTKTRPTGPGS